MSVPMITTNPELDEQRRRGLRRMRSVAVGLLLLAAVVYLLTLERDGFLGFVNAGAEASMVGRSRTGSPSPRCSSTRWVCRSRTPR